MGKIFQRVVDGSSELAHVQTKQWETSRGAAAQLQTSLNSMREGDLSTLVRSLQDMGVRLDTSNNLIAQIYDDRATWSSEWTALANHSLN